MAKVLLVGAGHAHLATLKNLRDFTERGHDVAVLSDSGDHFYSGLGPGVLGGSYAPGRARFDVKRMAEERGARFVEARAEAIDPSSRTVRTDAGEAIPYDVCSFNIGSRVPVEALNPSEDANVVPAKPIVNLARLRERLIAGGKAPRRVVVVGGGASGVEIAGNLRRLAQRVGLALDVVLVSGRGGVLPGWPDKARLDAIASLGRRGVAVKEGPRIVSVGSGGAALEGGERVECDEVVAAVGIVPGDLFRRSGQSTGPQGDLTVNDCLQSVDFPQIFGGGDCVTLKGRPLDKVGVYAVRQNPVLRHNLLAALEERPLRAFDPGGAYVLILNLGDGRGLFRRGGCVLTGRPVFWLKHRLDMGFMKRYQVSGERAGTD